MKTLGAVLAGGMSRRFGSDKAQARLAGRTLLDRAIAALYLHCEEIVIVGRDYRDLPATADWPRPGMGPLGGIAGGLDYAARHGFDRMLSIPVDCVTLPVDLDSLLEPAPSYMASQPVIGLWPVTAFGALREMLIDEGDLAVMAFARKVGARAVHGAFEPPNINTVEDLERLESQILPDRDQDRR